MGFPVLIRGAQLANRLRTANKIVPFVRKASAVRGLSANARAAELLAGTKVLALPTVPSLTGPLFRTLFTATSFLVGIWATLNKPKREPASPELNRLEDWSPFNFKPGKAVTIEYTRIEHQNANYRDKTCYGSSDDLGPTEPVRTVVTRAVSGYDFRINTDECVLINQCTQPDATVKQNIWKLETQSADGSWKEFERISAFGGTSSTKFNYTEPIRKWVELESLDFREPQPDLEPVKPIPKPVIPADPRTVPLPMAQAVPAMVPTTKPKVITMEWRSPVKPKGDPLVQPQPQVEPVKKPVRIPTIPIPAPVVQPKPKTTTQTTIEGKQVPPRKAIVTTTPSDVHKFGNAGGRVAGRTASVNPTQIAQELGRVEQKLAQIAKTPNTIGNLADILRLLGLLYEWTTNQKAGTVYELEAFCECPEDDDQCEEPKITIETPGGDYRDETLARLDAVAELLQPLKSWKQPICNEKVQLAGDFRTISFISAERTLAGDRYLSKRFRYRSQSGADLDTLVDHWKDFQWDAGPVCVQHSGHSWGTPQVWAASVNEGKRVIFHAGREAGVDPDKVGKWTVSGSNNPRFGLSGRMRVNTKGGYYWITERLGSSERPLVLEL